MTPIHSVPQDSAPARSPSRADRILRTLTVLALLPASSAFSRSINIGPWTVRPIRHATILLTFRPDKGPPIVIAADPWTKAPVTQPKADLVLITDIHFDHLDPPAIHKIASPSATIVAPPAVMKKAGKDLGAYTRHALANGESWSFHGIQIKALPMYNTSPERRKYHTKGRGNGYILSAGGRKIYIAGDTECIPVMKHLPHLDLAFLPINLPYTMSADEAATCARTFHPDRVIPYHYAIGDADPKRFQKDLEGSGITVILP